MIFRLSVTFLFGLFMANGVFAQVRLKGASDIGRLKWWLGAKVGIAFTRVQPIERFEVLSGAAERGSVSGKDYTRTFRNLGQTAGVIFGYAVTEHILVTFQPSYSNYKYSYTTDHVWRSAAGDAYSISTKQSHRLGYVELPIGVLLRKQIGHIEPYVNFGWHYGVFMGGRKKIKYTESITEGGVLIEQPAQTEVIGMNDYTMKSQMGLAAGVGVAYTIQYFRLGVELAYRQGQYNITNEKQRYANKHMVSKFFEVPDDVKLNQLELTINMFMPVDNLIHLHASQKSKGGKR